MANRSDRNSVLPRQIKRMLALSTYANQTHEREVRELFMEAHAHEKRARVRMLAARTPTSSANED